MATNVVAGRKGFASPPLTERFWSKVSRISLDECWLWTGSLDRPEGYGCFWRDGRKVRAHRLAYELIVGPIPNGLVLDHLCRNPACVNPAHLDPVTHRENVMRGIAGAPRSHCPHGHVYDHANTHRTPTGGIRCRACARLRDKLRYAPMQERQP